jgi:hypothetical protein
MKKLIFYLTIITIAFWLVSCEDEKDIPVEVEKVENMPVIIPNNPILTEDLSPATVQRITVEPKATPLSPEDGGVLPALTPDLLEATLKAEESVSESKVLFIPEDITPPKTDILICFDLTGSMGGELANVKVNAANIITSVRGSIADSYFGVISHMDYNGSFSGCGYSATYGDGIDYPYSLDQAITSDEVTVVNAINALVLGSGRDGPEDYTRVFYESYADASIGFRTGTKKIVLAFLDAIPHDCAYDAILGGTPSTSGPDPGRDNTVGTADDLAILDVLNGMFANNITLIPIFSGSSSYFSLWNAYAGETGGQAFQINFDGTIPGGTDIADYITSIIEGSITEFNEVKLEVCDPTYSAWLTSSTPVSYGPVVLDADKYLNFDITITVPVGTEDGEYCFDICAVGDGVELSRQSVCITVLNEIDVAVDIKPGSCPNPLNTKDRGQYPVAILGTADFDVSQVDPATIQLEGVSPLRWAFEDVATPYYEPLNDCYSCTTMGLDGFMDMTIKFNAQEFIAALGPDINDGDCLIVELTGNLKPEYGSTPIKGYDIIKIIKQ